MPCSSLGLPAPFSSYSSPADRSANEMQRETVTGWRGSPWAWPARSWPPKPTCADADALLRLAERKDARPGTVSARLQVRVAAREDGMDCRRWRTVCGARPSCQRGAGGQQAGGRSTWARLRSTDEEALPARCSAGHAATLNIHNRPKYSQRAYSEISAKLLKMLGWPMGFEPTTTGITIRDSTVELRPPRLHFWPARQDSNLRPPA